MYSLTDKQIDFILNDISARGVKLESLQQSLLDHVCCILEKELSNENDFDAKYNEVIKTFFKNDLAEIQDETVLLLTYKNYYFMKRIFYVLLFLSVSYNLIMAGRFIARYLEMKREMSEVQVIKGVTLEEGTKDLKREIKQQYPTAKLYNKIYISFLSNFHNNEIHKEMAETFGITEDSLKRKMKYSRDLEYKQVDSLANVFPRVTFVIAYQRTAGDVDKCIEEYKPFTKNVLFLKGMNKLYSGYENELSPNPVSRNASFVIDSTGNLVYHKKGFLVNHLDSKLIKILSEK